jgi:hypothetical protein
MRAPYLASRSDSLLCPLCESEELRPSGHDLALCDSRAGTVSGAMLEALRQIVALPDVPGKHACEECGHGATTKSEPLRKRPKEKEEGGDNK